MSLVSCLPYLFSLRTNHTEEYLRIWYEKTFSSTKHINYRVLRNAKIVAIKLNGSKPIPRNATERKQQEELHREQENPYEQDSYWQRMPGGWYDQRERRDQDPSDWTDRDYGTYWGNQ